MEYGWTSHKKIQNALEKVFKKACKRTTKYIFFVELSDSQSQWRKINKDQKMRMGSFDNAKKSCWQTGKVKVPKNKEKSYTI